MAFPSVTYTFTNGTTADATQVNQNYSDLINGISDGTKDISIAALTAAGTASLNGAVALGNSSSDDITVTGSLASSIPIKTTATYNFGSSTLGLLSVYLSASSSYTVRLLGSASATESYTITFPVDDGTADYPLVNVGSGVTRWGGALKTNGLITGEGGVVSCDNIAGSMTGNVTLTVSDKRQQSYSPTAARTLTLPTTGIKAGEVWVIENYATTSTYIITVNASGGAVKDYVLPTGRTSFRALQDTPTLPAHWLVVEASSGWIDCGAVTITGATSNPTKGGTVSRDKIFVKRAGDMAIFRFDYLQTAGGAAGSGDYRFTLPLSLALDTNKVLADSSAYTSGQGSARAGTTFAITGVIHETSTSFSMFYAYAGSATVVGSAAFDLSTATILYGATFQIPISGWNYLT